MGKGQVSAVAFGMKGHGYVAMFRPIARPIPTENRFIMSKHFFENTATAQQVWVWFLLASFMLMRYSPFSRASRLASGPPDFGVIIERRRVQTIC